MNQEARILRWVILAALMLTAMLLYVSGFGLGAMTLIVLGAAFEMGFWVYLLRTPRQRRHRKMREASHR